MISIEIKLHVDSVSVEDMICDRPYVLNTEFNNPSKIYVKTDENTVFSFQGGRDVPEKHGISDFRAPPWRFVSVKKAKIVIELGS